MPNFSVYELYLFHQEIEIIFTVAWR